MEKTIEIIKKESQSLNRGSAENFTGEVMVRALFPAHEPGRTTGGEVSFKPGARTFWHTHPYGQTLIVSSGLGRVQQWQGPIIEIEAGDVIFFPAGLKHWHGAGPDTSMTHIAIQEESGGLAVTWLEQVTDQQYAGGDRSNN